MASLSGFSVLLGYTSIACWLGAQLPQVVENIKRQSCEGLALPFLVNWLLGRPRFISYLLQQLPFQTWLAAYFVTVDLALFGQYHYYQRKKFLSYGPPKRTGTSTIRRMSIDRTPRYRTLSAVAANVAAAAALAAEHDELHYARRGQGSQMHHSQESFTQGSSRVSRETIGEGEVPATLADSFISEGGLGFGRKQVSWGIEPHGGRGGSVGRYSVQQHHSIFPPVAHEGSSSNAEAFLSRGRTLHRDSAVIAEAPLASSLRRASKASRQGSGMVFLSVFAMFSLGSLVHLHSSAPAGSINHSIGRVLSTQANVNVPPAALHSDILSELTPKLSPRSDASSAPSVEFDVSVPPSMELSDFRISDASGERILGRFFAWLCTTLYLTSRLPQIWKNYVRKSVEGLSIYLFIFAFLGNVFYVASILTSPEMFLPQPASGNFIRESIPYLLGSGGTLMFDLTIVTQAYLYRPHLSRHRGGRHSRSRTVEEEARLLAEDHPRQDEESVIHSRGRTRSHS
ncbi:hypothetical protein D9758_000611 [Tetrapyrgos nigripes]|uniref:PQ loop repeat-domain-containing protein n=1 Tax=Tetrapyrgos nigripes TaxID=182062 RepID=A0A8H5LXP1_9AGAR|nr:hypothetical protein D9758_000611 [Tetrapyrgos nigripes]